MAKFQVPTVGGIRKVIKPGATVSNATTIAGLEGTTLTLAQLSQLLATLDKNTGGGNIGTGAEAAISVGPGLAGGGPLVGVVNIRLTAPLGALGIVEDGADGNDGPPGPPGKAGAAGATGGAGPPGPAVFFLADDGADGDLGPPGPPGPIGQTGTGTTGSTGAQGPIGPGLFFLADDGQDGDNGPPGAAGVAGVTGTTGSVGPVGPAGPAVHMIADDYGDDQGFMPPLVQNISPNWTGQHTFTPPPGGNITINASANSNPAQGIAIISDGIHNVEIVIESVTAGDAYYRISALGVINWSFGVRRADGSFICSPAVGLGAPKFLITTTGSAELPNSPLESNVTQVQTGVANFKSGQSTLGTTTLTLDSSLIVTCNETGWYFAELFLPCYEKILGTAGFKFDLDGGNASVGNVAISVATNAVVGTGVTMTGLNTTAAFGTLSTVATNPTWIAGNGTINITGAGSIGIRVAQNTLNALTTETTVLATGASLILTKIG